VAWDSRKEQGARSKGAFMTLIPLDFTAHHPTNPFVLQNSYLCRVGPGANMIRIEGKRQFRTRYASSHSFGVSSSSNNDDTRPLATSHPTILPDLNCTDRSIVSH